MQQGWPTCMHVHAEAHRESNVITTPCHASLLTQLQCQEMQADLLVAEERSRCLSTICGQLQQQLSLLLKDSNSPRHQAQPASPAAGAGLGSPARAGPAPPGAYSCMAALAHNIQQTMQQQQQQHTPSSSPAEHSSAQAEAQAYCCHAGRHADARTAIPGRISGSPHATPAAAAEPGVQQQPTWQPAEHDGAPCTRHVQACSPQHAWSLPALHPSSMMPLTATSHHTPSRRTAPMPVAAVSPQPLSGLMGELQAGVARLQQQLRLSGSQQQLLQRGWPAGSHGALPTSR